MAKEEKTAEVGSIQMSADILTQMIATAVTTAVEEMKKPTREIQERRKREKQFWLEQQKFNQEVKERRESLCQHIRPEDGKSLFFWMQVVYPPNAEAGVCCRCFKEVKNYREHKIVDDPDFAYWRNVPTGIFNG